MTFQTKRLGTVADFIRGVSFKPDDVQPLGTENTIACFRTKNVQSEIDLNDVWAVPSSTVNRDEQILQEGDLLISTANSWNLVGKCCWVPRLDWPATLGGFISALRPKRTEVFPRFLYHWFSFAPIQAKLRGCARQTTNISNLDLNQALDLRIPLPPMEEQRRIAAILDKADALRQKRRIALQKLDSLILAIFFDMFGDPTTNSKCFEIISLGELGKWQSGGTPPRSNQSYFEGGIPWFSSGELESMYVANSREYITKAALSETSVKAVPSGSLLLGMYDTAALKASIASVDCSCNQAIAFAKINNEFAQTGYVYYAITIGREHFRRLQRGVRQKNLNLNMIKQIVIPLPAMPLQRRFVAALEEIAANRKTSEAAVMKAEKLSGSLQHRAFRGEL